MERINILITHVSYQASAGSFIKMLRNSKLFDYHIIGCDPIEKGFSSGSMLVDQFFHTPYETTSPDYINFIKKICSEYQVDLIISAEEEDLITFKKHKIEQALYKYIPDVSIFNLFQDKHLANMELQKRGILIPRTITNWHTFLESTYKTFISRKRISCSSRGIKILDSKEITSDYSFFTDDYIFQEFIEGKIYTVDVFCDKAGVPHLIIPRESLSCKDGTTFKCIIEEQKSIIEICREIYSLYCIPGISNIQFIVSNENVYFIELNLRAAATVIASSLVSVNFLDLYVSHFLFNEALEDYELLMNAVHWNSVISRYYEETILLGENGI